MDIQDSDSMFASDLGWRPGHFPPSFQHAHVTYIRRNKKLDGEGDLQYVDYECDPVDLDCDVTGTVKRWMRIFND